MPKTSAERQERYRQKQIDAGLIDISFKFWIKPQQEEELRAEIHRLVKKFKKDENKY